MNQAAADEPQSQTKGKLLEKVLSAVLKEQKTQRCWNNFFRLLFFSIFICFLVILWPRSTNLPNATKAKAHIGLIDIRGIIDDSSPAAADNTIEGLENAFADKNTQAVVLRINSPGGSPVQASQIYQEIVYLQKQHPHIKIYAACGDLCASAAYYIAAASNYIYANPSSLVGSIGVIMDGFGFVDSLKKLGIQRRLLTAGEHKGFLDPFSPENQDEKASALRMLQQVHQQFIRAVQTGRGTRLKQTPELFSGLAWTGEQALQLGLIDGYGDLMTLTRDVLKNKNIIDYTVKPGILQQLSDRLGAAFAQQISTNLGIVSRGFK